MPFESFGAHVFPEQKLRELAGPEMTPQTADRVAAAMESWARALGATHYCHWFQPLTGATAEKHMSFLSGFTGKQLLLGESDASSFPSGGLRQTAYARGYTAWDMTSPVFVKESAAGRVLCIPAVFISHSGDALDLKTPLLRSMEAVNAQALRLLRLFGKRNICRVTPLVGAEQEYFLIDRQKYLARRDLRHCGRTLFGAPAPKGQEMEDQYYGVIPPRAGRFMQRLNRELWLLGIPAAAQHNEVAPAQHELAPLYAPAHIAADQNQLTMERMGSVARSQGLECLLHEKPFARINGSGKHNNWSLGCDNGENLLDPGKEPRQNLQFQLILACILRAVDTHGDLLRLSAGSVGNDARLGGQEAPPPIVSVFLGQRLEGLVQSLLGENEGGGAARDALQPGTAAVAPVDADRDDRNRTSPFAFTGNKFEFRMVGSSDSIAMANTVLNTIVAEAFGQAADILEEAGDFSGACRALVGNWLRQHRRIIFSGDSYSPRWAAEAKRRGLFVLPGLVDAIPALTAPKALQLFGRLGVFTPTELESRSRVLYETYAKRLAIEARTMLQLARRDILPAVRTAAPALREEMQGAMEELQEKTALALAFPEARQQAECLYRQGVPAMERLRQAVDELEQQLPRSLWPMPGYEDLLFDI